MLQGAPRRLVLAAVLFIVGIGAAFAQTEKVYVRDAVKLDWPGCAMATGHPMSGRRGGDPEGLRACEPGRADVAWLG